jgi:7,8-dihydropterin-6-yl-methyl-4-(beta-D-ribofuranosyl)aminobenzene 5'-phosphate synthase
MKLSDNVCFLGRIPGERKRSLGEVADGNDRKKDFLIDDTGIAISHENSIIVLAGCAHSGIANIVQYAFQKLPGKKTIVIGGFHMHDMAESEIADIIKRLDTIGVSKVYPGHCTGKEAITSLLGHFPGEKLSAGKIIYI